MKRGRRILLVSHCVLNQNSVVHPLARASGPLRQAVALVVEFGVGIYQLPCPEMVFGGLGRAPASRHDYDTPAYRTLCVALADRVVADLRPMLADGCRIIGVLAVKHSPSCSVSEPRGIWMEELLARPDLGGVPAVGIPEDCCIEREADDQPSHHGFWRTLRAILQDS